MGAPWRAPTGADICDLLLFSYMPRNRKHIRLRDYDYSWQNAYFITICTKERKNFFCQDAPVYIPLWEPGTMLSSAGQTAERLLLEIPKHFPHAFLDEYAVMPNHIHCILVLGHISAPDEVGDNSQVEDALIEPQFNQFHKAVKGSVSVIINQFKGAVKRWCNANEYTHFDWQSRFYDHVIRNSESHEKIRQYIINNARNWCEDKFYFTPLPGEKI